MTPEHHPPIHHDGACCLAAALVAEGGWHLSKPQRIQLGRTKGWRMPPNTVRVSRPSMWSNPFTHPDPTKAVEAFRQLITNGGAFRIEPGGLQFAKSFRAETLEWWWPRWVRKNIDQIRGKNLGCWCPLDQPCHADVLLEVANAS
jgi:glycine cleavage system aminomethyltransferase T